MYHKIIVIGDDTNHGRKVISGSSVHTVDGLQYYPGGKPHGVNKIVTAHPTIKDGDVPVDVEGYETECGCKQIGSKRARAE